MKKYFIDWLVGLLFGLAFFFGVGLIFQKNLFFLDWYYYLVFIPIFVSFKFVQNRKKLLDFKNLILPFFVFGIGFFLPMIFWLVIVWLAFQNADFIL